MAVDEYTFNLRLGREQAKKQLEKHWENWVKEEDFKRIKNYGFNYVRIPIGWWIFGDSPIYYHNISHLDRGMDLASKYGLKVLIDLHGAPGSQNGFDNSGVACSSTYNFLGYGCVTNCQEKPDWITNKENLYSTQQILMKVIKRYENHPAMWGLGFVNEPLWDVDLNLLKEWYKETYNFLRNSAPDWIFLMHDSFRPYSWENFMNNRTEYYNFLMEQHIYIWPNNLETDKTESQILQASCELIDKTLALERSGLESIVGEWSLGIDDGALWLLGFLSTPKKQFVNEGCEKKLKKFNGDFYKNLAKNQLWAFEQVAGWFFWNFKNELEDYEWSWYNMVENEWVPRDVRKIPEFFKDSMCQNHQKQRSEL